MGRLHQVARLTWHSQFASGSIVRLRSAWFSWLNGTRLFGMRTKGNAGSQALGTPQIRIHVGFGVGKPNQDCSRYTVYRNGSRWSPNAGSLAASQSFEPAGCSRTPPQRITVSTAQSPSCISAFRSGGLACADRNFDQHRHGGCAMTGV